MASTINGANGASGPLVPVVTRANMLTTWQPAMRRLAPANPPLTAVRRLTQRQIKIGQVQTANAEFKPASVNTAKSKTISRRVRGSSATANASHQKVARVAQLAKLKNTSLSAGLATRAKPSKKRCQFEKV